ncbi:MAG TPA: M20/M25/M40 family metallo-hydrolase, partial [Bacilli bacterium]
MKTPDISAEKIMSHVSNIVAKGPRIDGSPASIASAEYIGDCLKSYGCNVNFMPLEFPYVDAVETCLEVNAEKLDLKVECLANGRSCLTDSNGIEAEAVFVGVGLEEDYAGKDVKGKVVFVAEEYYWQGDNLVATKFLRAVEHGAAAFVFSDKRNDGAITCWTVTPDLTKIPSVSITFSDYLRLKELAKTEKLKVRLKVTGKIQKATDYIVSGFLPGTDPEKGNIIINGSHHETVAFCPGANDNASGNAIMLELARYFSQIEHKHNLIFLSTCAEECACYGIEKYIDANRELISKTVAAFIVDQVAGGNAGIMKTGSKYNGKSLTPTEEVYISSPELTSLLVNSAEKLGYLLPVYDLPGGGMGEAGNFLAHNVPAVFICGWNTDLAYHTKYDTLDKISANSLKA